jgi:hypothetical protein
LKVATRYQQHLHLLHLLHQQPLLQFELLPSLMPPLLHLLHLLPECSPKTSAAGCEEEQQHHHQRSAVATSDVAVTPLQHPLSLHPFLSPPPSLYSSS